MNDIRPCGNNEKWCESCVSKGKCNYTKNQGIIAELEKLEEKIIRNSRPYREKLVIDVYTCQILIRKEIAELKGESNE